jgi:hypothetical protein
MFFLKKINLFRGFKWKAGWWGGVLKTEAPVVRCRGGSLPKYTTEFAKSRPFDLIRQHLRPPPGHGEAPVVRRSGSRWRAGLGPPQDSAPAPRGSRRLRLHCRIPPPRCPKRPLRRPRELRRLCGREPTRVHEFQARAARLPRALTIR